MGLSHSMQMGDFWPTGRVSGGLLSGCISFSCYVCLSNYGCRNSYSGYSRVVGFFNILSIYKIPYSYLYKLSIYFLFYLFTWFVTKGWVEVSLSRRPSGFLWKASVKRAPYHIQEQESPFVVYNITVWVIASSIERGSRGIESEGVSLCT